MRVTILGSGSQGNATLVETGGTRLLIDAGLSAREIRLRAKLAHGKELGRLDAILITHAHNDHCAHAGSVAKAFGAPVYVSRETRRDVDLAGAPMVLFERRGRMRIGALKIRTHPVPHDAPQVALVLRDDSDCVGLVTDLGRVPESLGTILEPCRTLLLEFNHEPELLALAPYPESVRLRVGGNHGHLANAQAAGLVRLLAPGLRRLVLMHLSESNNSPVKATRAARRAIGERPVELFVAEQNRPLVLDDGADQLSLAI